MPYTAKVLPVMIASPGDVLPERRVVRDEIHEWNYINSPATNVVLMPVGWETHSSPDLSGPPQELINERVLKDCDLLVGIFWTRVGTPTGKAASGSIEEVERHLTAGKPAMIYFSTAPVAPESLDPTQYAALREFKQWCKPKGLIEEYENLPELGAKFRRQLQLMLRDNIYLRQLLQEQQPGGDTFRGTGEVIPFGSTLSDEAKQLLVEAAKDTHGQVLKFENMAGRRILTNGKTFGEDANARTMARWDHALEQLVEDRLLSRGTDQRIFRITQAGYTLADQLAAMMP